MTIVLMLFLTLFPVHVFAQKCPAGTFKSLSQFSGIQCVPRISQVSDVLEECLGSISPISSNAIPAFPFPLNQSKNQAWWVTYGDLNYPNLHYPGPWAYPGIQKKYYPGEGEVFAAKPNVYVDTVTPGKKFNFSFLTRVHFLATTPLISKSLSWKGKLGADRFEIDDIYYDYLFYDVRLPKEKMQFENGLCADREGAIQWMLNDLKAMKYSAISLQDFEEHWTAKIPDYPYYCIYPQYNGQLDPIIPVEIDIQQNTFIRSLYVMIPFKKAPEGDEVLETPLPVKDPSEFRPSARIKREVEFREWGVAFLGY